MELKGERLLETDRATTWRLLNDIEVLKRCVPGCESMTAAGDNVYEVVMSAAVGPLRARFKGRMTLADIEPPSRYRLQFEAQSAQAGFVRGQTWVELEAPAPRQTRLRYTASAQVGGKLAQIGSRLIDAATRATTDKFFEAFAAQLAGAAAPAGEGASPALTPARGGLWRWLLALAHHLLPGNR